MERNVNVETYLTLSKEGLKETRKGASEEAITSLGEEDGKDDLHYPDSTWEVDELYFEKGELMLSGGLSHNGKELGYLSPSIPLGNDTIIEIIDYYMEKMEKVKAVLEATK